MAAAQITFDCVDRPRPQIKYQKGGTLTLQMSSDGVQQKPTSATVTILRPGGGPCTTPVSGAAVTVDGTTGTMTYALTAGNADMLPAFGDAYTPWTAQWDIVLSGTHYYYTNFFDVVMTPIYLVVTQADLQVHHKDLTDSLFTGTNAESDAQLYINAAVEDVHRRLENAGNRHWLILDSETLRRPTEHLALAKFFAARVTGEPNDRWKELRDYHQREADEWFQSQKFIYDYQSAGFPTAGQTNRPLNQMFFRT